MNKMRHVLESNKHTFITSMKEARDSEEISEKIKIHKKEGVHIIEGERIERVTGRRRECYTGKKRACTLQHDSSLISGDQAPRSLQDGGGSAPGTQDIG